MGRRVLAPLVILAFAAAITLWSSPGAEEQSRIAALTSSIEHVCNPETEPPDMQWSLPVLRTMFERRVSAWCQDRAATSLTVAPHTEQADVLVILRSAVPVLEVRFQPSAAQPTVIEIRSLESETAAQPGPDGR
ncbi:MAG: hypothetical protein QF733_05400 [Phycisphaerales bacterium]|nr:hypothetical protein [Phycisphaerales bacterium]